MSDSLPRATASQVEGEKKAAIDGMVSISGIDFDDQPILVLRDWSAQDFANIYVRFRPHLIAHGRKFLRDETQAEEVVQDAFLYLMTALPELDSELGVLRFLKWKTKMLCLDLIRSNQSGLHGSLVPIPENLKDEAQPLDSIERADDAAIIRLALAKLTPRHREALISTMYEEKSYAAAARQMGISENAFRQLLFRARSSFRQALVGEASTEGKSVSEILTIAAKRSGVRAVASVTSVGVFLLVGLVSFGSFGPERFLLTSSSEISQVSDDVVATNPDQTLKSSPELQGASQGNEVAVEVVSPPDTGQSPDLAPSYEGETSTLSDYESQREGPVEQGEISSDEASFGVLLGEKFASSLAYSAESKLDSRFNGQTLILESGRGLSVFVGLDPSSELVIQHVSLLYSLEGAEGAVEVSAVPTRSLVSKSQDSDGNTLVSYAATDFIFGDMTGTFGNVAISGASAGRSAVKIELLVSAAGDLVESTLMILPRA